MNEHTEGSKAGAMSKPNSWELFVERIYTEFTKTEHHAAIMPIYKKLRFELEKLFQLVRETDDPDRKGNGDKTDDR